MILHHDEIKFKRRTLIKKGVLVTKNTGIYLMKGENGSGKTSLFKNIFLNEKNKDNKIIYVDQNNNVIFNKLKTLENITLGNGEEKISKARTRLKELDLNYLENRNQKTLSGGEKRLVGFLRGIIEESNILIIDEPTNDLSAENVVKIKKIIKEESEERLIFIISHDDRMKDIADNILKIEDKKIQYSVLESEDREDKKLSKRVIETAYLTKTINYNFLSIIILAVLVSLSLITIYNLHKNIKDLDNQLPTDQVELYGDKYAIYNGFASDYTTSKTYALTLLNDNFITKIKKIPSNKEKIANSFLIEKEETYEQYPLNIVNRSTNKDVDIINLYLNVYHNTNINETNLDTNEYFYLKIKDSKKPTYKLDLALYNKLLKDVMRDEDWQYTRLIIKLKTVNLNNFLKNLKVIKIAEDKDIYVTARKIINEAYEVDYFFKITNSLIKNGIIAIYTTAIALLFLEIIVRLNKQNIYNLKNYSIEKEKTAKILKKKINNKISFLPFIALVIVFEVVMTIDKKFNIFNYLNGIMLTLIIALIYGISNKVIRWRTNSLYKWSSR